MSCKIKKPAFLAYFKSLIKRKYLIVFIAEVPKKNIRC